MSRKRLFCWVGEKAGAGAGDGDVIVDVRKSYVYMR